MILPELRLPSPIQLIDEDFCGRGIALSIKRDDLIHPWISGNKWRKLCKHAELIASGEYQGVVSFGGAFSNHLVAVAAYAFQSQIPSVGIVRSYKYDNENPTFTLLKQHKMSIDIVPPKQYQKWLSSEDFNIVKSMYPDYHIVPQGGTDSFGVQGSMSLGLELLEQDIHNFDFLILAIGTGGTLAGLTRALSTWHGSFLAINPFGATITDIEGMKYISPSANIEWVDAHLGNFGSYHEEIVDFIHEFYEKYQILLEPIYTAKAMMTLQRRVQENYLPSGSKVLFVHTGGLQGILGFNYLHSHKKNIVIPNDGQYKFLIDL